MSTNLENAKEIIVSVRGSIAEIQLNRPNLRNSFNSAMIQLLTEAFGNVSTDPNVRVVILSGTGKVFCAGADVAYMQSMVNFSLVQNKSDAETLYQLFASMAECPVPIVGQIHGAAYGGALGLIANCDYVIAESKTQFCFSEVKIGISPAVISSFVARKCFLGAVKPFMLSGEVMDVPKALHLGLVNEKAEGLENLSKACQSYAQKFLECGPEAVRETKKMLQDLNQLSWIEQRNLTTQVIAERRISNEGQEGLKAFLEKRKPTWNLS